MTQLLASGEGRDLAALLRDRGWKVSETLVAEVAASYGRDLADPFGVGQADHAAAEPPWLETCFVHGTRAADARSPRAGTP